MPTHLSWILLRLLAAVCIAVFLYPACGDGQAGSDAGGNGGSGGSPPQNRVDGGAPPPGGDGPPPGSLADCGTFAPGNDLNVCTATYLGGPGADRAVAVELAADGTVIMAAIVPERDLDSPETALLGGGPSLILRLSPTGGEILSAARLPGTMADMELDPSSGAIAVGGDFGVALLSPGADQVMWSSQPGAVRRVAVGANGPIAALVDTTITVYGQDGGELGSFALSDGTVSDIAVYGPGPLVIATGFNQVSGNLQQPFLRAYDPSGSVVWTAYDWSASEAGSLSSDTRGTAVAIGRDNYLYYAGESHGGVTTHFKDPQNLNVDAPIVRFDRYNESSNWNGAAPLAFYARFNAESGEILLGQLIAPRLSTGRGNGSSIHSIAASEDGTVIVGGQSACCIEAGAEKTIDGIPAMPGYAGGGFVLVASADFTTRHIWTAFSGTASGEIAGVAAWGSTMAAVQTHDADAKTGSLEGSLVTTSALQGEAQGGTGEAHLAVWPSP